MPIWSKLAIVGVLIIVFIGWHLIDKQIAVRASVKATESIYQLKLASEMRQAQEISMSLLNNSMQALQEKNNEIQNIRNSLSALNSKLQQRPSRKDSSRAPKDSGTCTGAELLREDGTFLAREAARADRILEERNYYYNEYRKAREALIAHQRANGG